MNLVQVKICGITRIDDAKICEDLGVELIGLNFYRPSPRYVPAALAREIVAGLSPRVSAVGIFVEPSTEEVRRTAAFAGLRCVQLHGNVSPDICRQLAQQFRVIRVLRTDDYFRPEAAELFPECNVLIDAGHPELHGGTGRTCDWSGAKAALSFTRFLILSGGLNAINVRQAIEAVTPHAVDVCSGVESAPGVKDFRAIEEFVTAVRA